MKQIIIVVLGLVIGIVFVRVRPWIERVVFEDEYVRVSKRQMWIFSSLLLTFFISCMSAIYWNVKNGYSPMIWHYVNMTLMLLVGFYMLGIEMVNHRPSSRH